MLSHSPRTSKQQTLDIHNHYKNLKNLPPLTLPTLDLINQLGLSSYVDYDAMVCRRSERVRKPRVFSTYGEYSGPKA